jgi:hypothetical protein
MIDDWSLPYHWKHCLTHPHAVIVSYARNIKWFFQRGWRGYADCDVWSIDYYIDEWMPSALRQLGKGCGTPAILCGEDSDNISLNKSHKKWVTILEQIAVGFEANMRLQNCEYNLENMGEKKELYRKCDKGLKLFIKYFNNLWN